MTIGYINAQTLEEQTQQVEILKPHCNKWFSEPINGKLNREIFDSTAERLREGDTLVVASVFSLPLTALQAIEFLTSCRQSNVEIKMLGQKVDMATVELLNELHRVKRKQKASGLLAQVRGAGRPKQELTQDQKTGAYAAANLYESKEKYYTVKEIMKEVGIKSKETLYKRLEFAGVNIDKKGRRRKPLEEKKKKASGQGDLAQGLDSLLNGK